MERESGGGERRRLIVCESEREGVSKFSLLSFESDCENYDHFKSILRVCGDTMKLIYEISMKN